VTSTELPASIVTVVSEPLTPFKDSRSPAVLFVAAGLVLGCAISVGWVLIRILSGLPFINPLQLESYLRLPCDCRLDQGIQICAGKPDTGHDADHDQQSG